MGISVPPIPRSNEGHYVSRVNGVEYPPCPPMYELDLNFPEHLNYTENCIHDSERKLYKLEMELYDMIKMTVIQFYLFLNNSYS